MLSLLDVAVEVMELIADLLDNKDLCSLRLVCKDLCRKTFHSFGNACSTFYTDLSKKEMQKLQNISENEVLRYHVHTLVLKRSSPYIMDRWFNDLTAGFSREETPSKYLEAPLSVPSILRGILATRLINCRSFCIFIHNEGGVSSEGVEIICSDIVGIVLAIIAKDGLEVRSFSISCKLDSGSKGLHANRFGMSHCRQTDFRSGWVHLTELYLNHSIQEEESDWVMGLILSAPRLQKLSLRFYNRISLIERPFSANTFLKLRYLKLTHMDVTLEWIQNLMISCRSSLRELILDTLKLECGGTWMTFLEDLKINFPSLKSISLFSLKEYRAFTTYYLVFPALSKNPILSASVIKKPLSSDCRLVEPMKLPIRLTFRKKLSGDGNIRVIGIYYHGPQMKAALDILVDTAKCFSHRQIIAGATSNN